MKVRDGRGSNWYTGTIRLSRDGKEMQIRDLRISEDIRINSLSVETNAIPEALEAINNLDNLNLNQVVNNSSFKLKGFDVSVSERYLNKLMAKIAPPSIKSAHIDLNSEGVILKGKAKVLPLVPAVPFSVNMIPSTSEGKLRLNIGAIHLMGGLPLPSFLKSVIMPVAVGLINSMLQGEKKIYSVDEKGVTVATKGIEFNGVRVADGEMSISGRVTG